MSNNRVEIRYNLVLETLNLLLLLPGLYLFERFYDFNASGFLYGICICCEIIFINSMLYWYIQLNPASKINPTKLFKIMKPLTPILIFSTATFLLWTVFMLEVIMLELIAILAILSIQIFEYLNYYHFKLVINKNDLRMILDGKGWPNAPIAYWLLDNDKESQKGSRGQNE